MFCKAEKKCWSLKNKVNGIVKGTVMQIGKALINDRWLVSKVSWKFGISVIYNFPVIYPWNFLFC